MLPQIYGEAGIVGVCKSVRGIVNQLSGGIVVQGVPARLILQALGNPGHVAFGVLKIMPPQPLGADGTLEIGGEVSVRFNAAQQKGPAVHCRDMGKIGGGKKAAQLTMTFSAHMQSP